MYVYLKYVGDGQLVSELERNLRLQDAVLKFQTVKVGKSASTAAPTPEDIEFEHLDVVENAEPEDSLAKTLGLEDVREEYRGGHTEAATEDAEEEVPNLNGEEKQ